MVVSPACQSASMRIVWLLLVAWIVCPVWAQLQSNSTTSSEQFPVQNGVLVLTEDTFANAVQAFSPLFVLFDSPARYGSLILQRRFTDAAQSVHRHQWNTNSTTRFASLDVSQLKHTLIHDLKVLGLPALLLFQCQSVPLGTSDDGNINGMLQNCAAAPGGVDVYVGGRTSMELQRFALGQPLREAIQITSISELDAIVATRPFVALFIVDGVDSQAFIDCRVLAQVDADTSTYVVATDDVVVGQSFIDGTEIPSLVLFREFGRERMVYDDEWNKANLLQFIQKYRYNVISTYTATDASFFFDRVAEGHVLIFSDPNAPYHVPLVRDVEDVASSYYVAENNTGRHVLRFLVVQQNETTLKNALFVSDDQFPTLLVVRNVSQPPFRTPFVGNSTIALIESGNIGQAISNELENIFPPFATDDLPDDAVISEEFIDWRNYSDLFLNKQVPFIIQLSTSPSPTSTLSQPNSILSSGPQFGVMDTDGTGTTPDPFLSIFAPPHSPLSLVATNLRSPQISTILSFLQLQALLIEHSPNGYILVVLHSPRCYSCRQAMNTLKELPSIALDIIAVVDIDNIDVREWPLRFDWLPGVFLFKGMTQVAVFPSRTAVTIDAVNDFMHNATSQIS